MKWTILTVLGLGLGAATGLVASGAAVQGVRAVTPYLAPYVTAFTDELFKAYEKLPRWLKE